MKSYNFSLTIFFIDPRPLLEVSKILEDAFGCTFTKFETDSYITENYLETQVLGVYLSIKIAASWTEGNVYRLSGGTPPQLYTPEADNISLNPYISQILKICKLQKIIEQEEFVAKMKALFPEIYSSGTAT